MAVNHQPFGAQLNHIYPRKLEIILNGNDIIIFNNEGIAEMFNDYFVNVADGIGKVYVFNPSDHSSLRMIDAKQFGKKRDSFEFKPTY